MNIFLDSSVLIEAIKGTYKFKQSVNYFINPIVFAETLYGLLYTNKKEELFTQFLQDNRIETLSIDEDTAIVYTKIKLKLRMQGKPIPDNDLLIAASCIEYKMKLATFNTKHFERIDGLDILALS